MEEKNILESVDNVKISEEVVAVITSVAASETEGVESVGGSALTTNWTDMLSGKKSAPKGIKILIGEDGVKIDLALVVKYGVSIPEVALSVQSAVKNAVEEMTGMTVLNVEVRVTGIKTEPAEKKQPEKKEEEKPQE